MDNTVYKRGEKGRKILKKAVTQKVKLKFKNKSVDITKQITIGRDPSCTIPINGDSLVSRKHALIEKVGDVYYINDLDSTNGTYVNNNPIKPHRRIKLHLGDVIKIGKFKMTIS